MQYSWLNPGTRDSDESAATIVEPRSRALIAFFVLAFLGSWLAWLPAALPGLGLPAIDLTLPFSGLLGAFGPTLAALIIVAAVRGRRGLGKLLRRALIWRVSPGWYLFVLFWPPLLVLAGGMIAGLLGSATPDYAAPPVLELYPLPPELMEVGPWPVLPFIFLQNLLIGSAMGEEIGWRGFALPRLQARMGALGASLVLGVVWAVWHLPLYLTPGHPLSDVFLGWTLLAIVGDAILFTWIFNHTRGSLLLALLFHASIATAGLFVATVEAAVVVELVLRWVLVGVVILVGSRLEIGD